MTNYLGVAQLQRMLAQVGAETMMERIADGIRDDFRRWHSFEKCARTANHSSLGVIELMPVSDEKYFAFKYVNGHPRNPLRRLPTVMAFGVLAEVATGYPLLLSELTITTALRTAATSVVAARQLARADSRSMALIGNGAQSEFQAIAFMQALGIREIRAYDVDPAATERMMANLAPYVRAGRLQVRAMGSVREAVAGADIVTTITADKSRARILALDMVEPGMHINAVGGDCPGKTELDPGILERATVAVEYAPQTRIEGEVQQMPADFPVVELWQLLDGGGRRSDDEITVFDSVGFALEDLSALRYLHQTASALNLGQPLDLIVRMDDPKDLYGCALGSAAAPAAVPTAVPNAVPNAVH
ncbi:ornithine cyclodeaminase [Comamonas endophytica]|uniref:Ornithine cyclodeaminase n=1 Tax=Comamonas endophytica TaxID=2949090 RepID=A0ABY6GHR4_9BURK|nr:MULTISPECIES: ornithine cyclodeaminase [unclassified Acidovorax]MCD2513311.1 ornithine cyclodeaminase [Acidovorax sp. D4N7]UYG53902.1 ornithine cyclodeaminase [Acidovorax sp. 5MLIR]